MLRDRVATAAIVAVIVAGCSFDLSVTSDGGPDDVMDIDAPILPVVSFAQPAMTQDETSGLVMAEVTLAPGATGPVTVPFTFSGTATINNDYTATPGTLTFALGETSKSIPVTIIADVEAEGPETILITLGTPTGAMLGPNTHSIEIGANTLARVNLGTAASMVDEATPVTLTLTLDKAANGPATVNYTVTAGTAVGSGTFADYTLASGVVNFPMGSTVQTLPLGVVNDLRNELDETLTITLTTSSGVVIGTTAPAQIHTILNNDAVPTLSFTPEMSTMTEGDAGTTTVALQVTLSAASGRTVTVPYGVNAAGTTMTSPSDYALVGTSLVFNEGETTKDIIVNVVGDVINEPTEELSVALTAPADGSATLAGAARQLTVTDNDPACVGAQPYRVCYNTAPAGAVALPASIDTTNSTLCETMQPSQWTGMQNQPTACVIRGTSITNTGTTTVTGSRPLVLAASDNITIDTLDVASHRGGTIGPGAPTQAATCTTGAVTPTNGSGGGGGSFLTKGGNGGTGDNSSVAGVSADTVTAPTALRAGCHGQQGNGGDETGKGGGVVYLAAGGTITITGGINASGSSAVGGGTRSGGSGGGSGGMIMLHAATITAPGAGLIANGAGGASGGDNDSVARNGNDPVLTLPTVPAPGGAGGGTGGTGGDGWAGMTAATNGANGANNVGGGGGGGGGGYIRSNVAITGATVSAGQIQIIP